MLIAAAHITPTNLWMLVAEYTARGPRLQQAQCAHLHRRNAIGEQACELLQDWLSTLRPAPGAFRLALSPELAALVHSFPLQEAPHDTASLAATLEFELEQFLTDYDRQLYTTFALVLSAGTRTHPQVVAVTYSRDDLERLRKIAAPTIPTEVVAPDLLAVAPLWRYNYPELCSRPALALHVTPPYLDIFALRDGHLASLSTRTLPGENPSELLATCVQSVTAVHEIAAVDIVFAFGAAVQRAFLDALSAELASILGTPLECRRLNAFRFWLPPEQERMRHYAIRTAHLFWGCSAVCLPPDSGLVVL